MTLLVESGPVQRKSRCPLRAKSGRPRCKKAYPLYPQYRTVRCEGKCPLGAISEQNLGRISVAFHSLGWSRGRRSNVGPSETSMQFRRKFVALAQSAHANAVNLWSVIDRRRIDWRSAIRTKRLLPLGAAFSCFDVYFRFTRSKFEGTLPCGHDAPKRRA